MSLSGEDLTALHVNIHHVCWWLVLILMDALATGKWYRIERRTVVFLCWMQDSNPGSLEPNLQQTECPLTNRMHKPSTDPSFHPYLYSFTEVMITRALCQSQCTPHARFPLTEGGGLLSGSPLLGRTGGVVELVLGSVFIIELDTGLAGTYFHRYHTEYDVCHKQIT